MANDILVLRFKAPEGTPTVVKPIVLSELVDRLEGLVGTLGPPPGIEHTAWLQFEIVASPRPACIEFLLSGTIYVDTVNVFAPEIQARATDVLESARDWVSFGLEVLGARYGIIEMFKRRERPKPPIISAEDVLTTKQLVLVATSTTLSTDIGQRAVAGVIGFASGLGYERVEIQFRDEPSINLVVEEETWDLAVMRGRLFLQKSPFPKGGGPFDFKIGRDYGLKVTFKGKPYRAVIGNLSGRQFLLVWGSAQPTPKTGDTVSVHGSFDPNSADLLVTEAVPKFSEQIGNLEGTFFVEKKITITVD